MAKETVYNNTLVSGAADETLTYTRYVKDESSGKSTKELLEEKVNKTDKLGTTQLENESVTAEKLAENSVDGRKVCDGSIENRHIGNNAVSTSKIASRSVTNEKIAHNSVSRAELTPDVRTTIDNKADAEQVNNSLYDLEKKIGERFVVEGDVTNLPDEEDLTSIKESERDVLKLADRSYAPEKFSGKGYKILRRNIKPVSIAVTKIRVESVPSADGTLSFTINGKETQVAVSASTDNTTALVAQKVASALQESMTEYDVSADESLITLTRKSGGSVTPSVFSASTTGVVCTITDSTKREFRNILTPIMINQPNTIYEIRYDFDLDGTTLNMFSDCVLKFTGGIIRNGKIVGAKTSIINSSNIEIFNKITFEGTWNVAKTYPEWFGAKGDGVTDDTDAISCAAFMAQGSTLAFMPKTYIINVKQGKEQDVQRVFFGSCKFVNLNGNGAVLKLGKDNGDKRINKGFGSIFSVSINGNLHVSGLTVDYNYSENPIYKTTGYKTAYEVNTQMMAFYVISKEFLLENCTFIDHSGNNCIVYAVGRNTEDLSCTIQNCKFLRCGHFAFYDNNGEIKKAVHDVSTCAIHYNVNDEGILNKFTFNLCNNFFEAVGGNGHNAVECSPHVLNAFNNVFTGYRYCIMPCAYQSNMKAYIYNNRFLNSGCAIRLWQSGFSEKAEKNPTEKIAYSALDIYDNYCEVNIPLMQEYADFNSIDGDSLFWYGFVGSVPGVTRSLGNISIRNNYIEYVNTSSISAEKVTNRTVPINFISTMSKPEIATKALCENMIITDNKFVNSPYVILFNVQNQNIKNFTFKKNVIINANSVKDTNYSYIMLWNRKTYNLIGDQMIGNLDIENNYIDNSLSGAENQADFILLNNVPLTRGLSADAKQTKLIKGNFCVVPRTLVLTSKSFDSIFDKIIHEEYNSFSRYGSYNNLPKANSDVYNGMTYFCNDVTPEKCATYTKGRWVDALGFSVGRTVGDSKRRPRSSAGGGILNPSKDIGYPYYDTTINKMLYAKEISADSYQVKWVDSLGNSPINSGNSENRPSKPNEGEDYYDSTLKKKILWNGDAWVNMDGTELT